MKAYEIGEQQGLASLTLKDRPDPTPGFGQVVLRVRAVCLNHRDLLALAGAYGPRRPANRIPVSDGIGEVIAIGDGVSNVKIGDRTFCGHFVTWLDGSFTPDYLFRDLGISLDGWLAEKILVPADALVAVPDALSDEQAAALPAAGLTAWNSLVEVGQIRAGDLVLALGTGGVSIFALQLAKMHGARVAITSSSDEKLAIMRSLGADITVNYKTTPDWATAVVQANGGTGANIVIETGGLSTLAQSIAAAAPNARIALIGALASGSEPSLTNLSGIVVKNLTLRGITAGNRKMMLDLVKAATANNLKPIIDRTFPFAESPAAYAYLKSGAHIGKIMIRV